MNRSLIAIALVSLSLLACNFEKQKVDSSADTEVPNLAPSQLSFAIVNQYVLAKSCTTCHAPGKSQSGLPLDQYSNVSTMAAAVKAQVDSGAMPKPPAPPLSAGQKTMLDAWLAEGAPQFAGGPPAPAPLPAQPNLPSIESVVIGPKCVSCHNPTGKEKNVLLSTAQELLCVPPALVVPGNPEAGDLMRMLNPANPSMPPKTSGVAPLTPQEYGAIQTWIANGALDGGSAITPGTRVTCPPVAPPPPIVPFPSPVTFASIKNNIFDQKCVLCHNPKGRAANTALDTIQDLTGGTKPLVVAGNMNSALIAAVSPGAKFGMPPANEGVAAVTDDELNAIKEWVQNGASD